MNLGTLLRPWALRAAGPGRAPAPPVALSRRRSARRSLAAGAAALALLTAGMAVALDAARPEWRDPEYYVRLGRLRRWQAEAPDRPLVVAFGSSRTQMGLCPAAMGYPDRPGSPLVFNMGYRGARPVGAYLHLARTLDAGVKPKAVLFQLARHEVIVDGPAEQQSPDWGPRFSAGDLVRLGPYTRDATAFPRRSFVARATLWATYRSAFRSDLLPDWQTGREKTECVWTRADEYGFIACGSESVAPAVRAANLARISEKLGRAHDEFQRSEVTERLLRDAVARCRAAGIAIAFVWAPTSLTYRGWDAPAARAGVAAYKRHLEEDLGARVLPEPDDVLVEEDFADGFHLLRHGAEKYSRWLADAHLTPWLRSQGLIDP